MLARYHPNYVIFPDPGKAEDSGYIGHGANLSINTLLSAYQQGIFPWFNDDEPILWWCPNPRMILNTDEMHVSHSLKKTLRSKPYRITCNTAFSQVISQCSKPRTTKSNLNYGASWITKEMQEAYNNLHDEGYGISIEAWQGDELVGGLYGVSIAGMFFGESMFAKKTDSSKIALFYTCQFLKKHGCDWIDCQVASEHLETLGAINIPRELFLSKISRKLKEPTSIPWDEFELIEPS